MLPGKVTQFDPGRGLGTVTADNGTEYVFHVIEIADGTRSIDVGQIVRFQPLAKFGQFQACKLRKV
jgi:cold shock CspA family protein